MQTRRESLEELLTFLLGRKPTREPPSWPPDLFALAAAVLGWTGAYVAALGLGPENGGSRRGRYRYWPRQCEDLARKWRARVSSSIRRGAAVEGLEPTVVPTKIRQWWQLVLAGRRTSVSKLAGNTELVDGLVRLLCVADSACAGIGFAAGERDPFLDAADLRLMANDLQSLTATLPVSRIRVLPKQHTPQRGVTLRSLSHHLALIRPAGVTAKWRPQFWSEPIDILNLLLLPWPNQVEPEDFAIVTDGDHQDEDCRRRFRYFQFRPVAHTSSDGDASFEDRFRAAVSGARRLVDRLHAVVMPELALTPEEFLVAEKVCLEVGCILIAGVNVPVDDTAMKSGVNACWIQPLGYLLPDKDDPDFESMRDLLVEYRESHRVEQAKHHRWCLDRNQIVQYGLGGRLPASRECWEQTRIGDRTLDFFTLDPWVTWSVLICEDLARQDPVSDVIRAVGPSLLIALLMDGPQLRNRWPARYASVLAEDPGTSVLTLTSLGMSCRSAPRPGETNRSRVIALWRDAHYGDQEIELPADSNACVLSLVQRSDEEFTSDGRSDGRQAHFPTYAGVHYFNVGRAKAEGST